MKLAPRMIQSMEILQMPLAELQERIEQELESNPTLEVAEEGEKGEVIDEPASGEGSDEGAGAAAEVDAAARDDAPLRIDEHGGAGEFERLESFEAANPEIVENSYESPEGGGRDEGDFVRRSGSEERDGKLDAFAATPARSGSLHDQLREQWALCEAEAALKPLGELVISFLDGDGYLRTALETIRDRAVVIPEGPEGSRVEGTVVLRERPTIAQLERALKAVQLFLEPAGVAARTASECLLLQLDAIEEDAEELGWPLSALASARRLVAEHLDDLMQNRLPRVAEKTGLTLEEIKEALTLLRRLSLAPARRLVQDEARAIVPDAYVEYDAEQDRYVAYLNDRSIANLRVNQEYARLAKERGVDKKDREFLRTNLGNAHWLIDAVRQRRQTLLRVIEKVVEAQRDFFDFGPQALKPLPMTLVAEKLGIHVATVSRAVAEKHLATPRGIVPLRKFFSGGVQTKTDGASDSGELAWDAIKAALKEVIDAEDKARPLSDEALVDELKKRGIEIARRTVAKYRDQLGIPTARLRKTF